MGNVTAATYRNASLPIGEFKWVVLALKNQQILCSTPTSKVVYRSDNPEAAPQEVAGPFNIQKYCTIPYQAKVAFNNLFPTEQYITITGSIFGSVNYNSTSGPYTFYSFQTVSYLSGPNGLYSGSWSADPYP